ncbi:hypothetical protein [Clostridium sp. JS66]|uniref:hypothetical protein n=1 Tax=Clostridium sp. JS66 TaxID=3064705 RepID=UPI00298E634F|nr:hypothetical protein [Clostridium sp. JS66]WPC40609.1 hypothetical protein Q6H37_22330 [Clostridium sp. JS66]
MNKKIKFLTPILCGTLLASGLALTNAQASSIKNDTTKVQSYYSYPETYQDYNYYTTLSEDVVQKLENYCAESPSHRTELAVNNFLQDNNLTSSSVANTISYELAYWINSTARAQDYGNGLTVLKVPDSLVRVTIIPNDQYNYDYNFYTKISVADADKISGYIDNPNLTVSQLASYLVNNNIMGWSYANKVAPLLLYAGHGVFKSQGRINYLNARGGGILVLQSKTNPDVLVLAPWQI